MRALAGIGSVVGALALLACMPTSGGSAGAPGSGAQTSASSTPTSGTAASTRGGTLTVRFLDVGQGDAELLATSDHHAMLIDAGPSEAAARIERALKTLGSDTLDAIVLTHVHADHFGRLESLARTVPFARWIDPGFDGTSPASPERDPHQRAHAAPFYERALEAARARGIPISHARRGDRFTLGAHVDVTVLSPSEPLFSHTRSDINSNSVVLRVDHHAKTRDARFLFAGDAEHPTEDRLLHDSYAELKADVLKVAHHGSKHATSDRWVEAVTPSLAVLSCGLGNDYGHPHLATLRRLAGHGAVITRTDVQGDITVTSDDSGLRWNAEHGASQDDLMTPGVSRGREAP